MQFLIVLSAALALTSATPGYLGAGVLGGHGVVAGLGYGGPAYHGPLASNVLTPTGHTVEVAAATANHINAVANVRATNGIVGLGGHGLVGVGALGVAGHHGGYASNVLTPTGHTVEVAAATANHLNAVANVRATNGILGAGAHGVGAYGVAGIHGLGAYGGALGVHGVGAVGYGAGLPAAYGTATLVDPVAIAAGAPLPVVDTHEVAAAKAAHFQAHVDAKHGLLGRKKRSPGYLGAGVLGYGAGYGYGGLGYGVGGLGYSSVVAHGSPLVLAGHGYGSPVWG